MAPITLSNRAKPFAEADWERWPVSVVGLGRFELPTSRLSSARSNQLSYRPIVDGLQSCEERETKTAVSRDCRREARLTNRPLIPKRVSRTTEVIRTKLI